MPRFYSHRSQVYYARYSPHAQECFDPLKALKKLVHSCNVKNTETKELLDNLENKPYNITIEELSDMIDHGADINAYNYDGKTPLLMAIENERLDIVRFLLENNALPEKPSRSSTDTPLIRSYSLMRHSDNPLSVQIVSAILHNIMQEQNTGLEELNLICPLTLTEYKDFTEEMMPISYGKHVYDLNSFIELFKSYSPKDPMTRREIDLFDLINHKLIQKLPHPII